MITYFQALVLGLLQGVTELFPISSLGHSVILPWLFNWHGVVRSEAQSESFFLSFLVALHVATAVALIIFYRDIWARIIKGFFGSLKSRKANTPDSRLAWLLIAATIPTGAIGLAFEHSLRTQFAKPLSAIIFITINGFMLLIGDYYLTKNKQGGGGLAVSDTAAHVSDKLTFKRAMVIGVAQVTALFAGISRSGVTMISGLYSGLNHEDAARFSFLLATPVILGAGLIKLPDFFSKQLDAGTQGQILVGAVAAGVAAYLAVRFLDKYFQNKTLKPFGIYCIGFGATMLLVGLVRGHF